MINSVIVQERHPPMSQADECSRAQLLSGKHFLQRKGYDMQEYESW